MRHLRKERRPTRQQTHWANGRAKFPKFAARPTRRKASCGASLPSESTRRKLPEDRAAAEGIEGVEETPQEAERKAEGPLHQKVA